MSQFVQFDPAKQPRCKVELHVHLEGSIRLTTAWELALKKGLLVKAKTLQDLIDSCCVKCPSTLASFLQPFALFMPTFIGDAEAIERVAFEFCEDAANQGVMYSEVRYCPHLMSTQYGQQQYGMPGGGPPVTPRDVVMCVNRGLNRGSAVFNITVRSILCCIRGHAEWSNEILELCLEFQRSGIVAIDVAGDEATVMAEPQIVDAFKMAASSGLHRTAHAGEAGSAKNVQFALAHMMAERIGHGYHVVDDPVVYHECLLRGVHFETCPYSSCLTGSVPLNTAKHPIVRLAEDNANFSISRDDPTIVQKTLDQEYEFLRGFGLKEVHFARANFNAARCAFLPENEKELLLQRLTEVYGSYRTQPALMEGKENYIPVKAMSGAGDF